MAYYDPMRDRSQLGSQIAAAGKNLASGVGEFLQNNANWKTLQETTASTEERKKKTYEAAKAILEKKGIDTSTLPTEFSDKYEDEAKYLERLSKEVARVGTEAFQKTPEFQKMLEPTSLGGESPTTPPVTAPVTGQVTAPVTDQMAQPPATPYQEVSEPTSFYEASPPPSRANNIDSISSNLEVNKPSDIIPEPAAMTPPTTIPTPIDVPAAVVNPEDDLVPKYNANEDPMYKDLVNQNNEIRGFLKAGIGMGEISTAAAAEKLMALKKAERDYILSEKKTEKDKLDALKEKRVERENEKKKTFRTGLMSNMDTHEIIDPKSGEPVPVTMENLDKVAIGEYSFARKKTGSGTGGGRGGDADKQFLEEQKYLAAEVDKANSTATKIVNGVDEEGNKVAYSPERYTAALNAVAIKQMSKALHNKGKTLSEAQSESVAAMDAPFTYDAPSDPRVPIVKDMKTGRYSFSLQYPGIIEKIAEGANAGYTAKELLETYKKLMFPGSKTLITNFTPNPIDTTK